MKAPLILGILLIVFAVVAFGYQGISYTKREKVLDIGPIQATTETKKPYRYRRWWPARH